MPVISIIIVSYNTREMTLACLRSVYEETKGFFYEVIVFDNASIDHSAQAISDEFPKAKLIKSHENIGFARANNCAAAMAQGEYLLFLNPDTVVIENAVGRLYCFARRHPEYRLYGGRTLFGDHSLNPTSCWRRPTLWSLFCYSMGLTSIFRKHTLFDPESYGPWQRDTVQEVDIVTGCLLMIEKKLWGQLDGFDPQFFMYGEDADLCLRAKTLGARPVITPEATIVHYGGASEKIRADKMGRLFRAKEQLLRRHWSPLKTRAGIVLIRTAVRNRALAGAMLDFFKKTENERTGCWQEIWRRRQEWQTTDDQQRNVWLS